MFCSQCGANVSAGAGFCAQCGQPVAAAPVAVAPAPSSIPLPSSVPLPPPTSYTPTYAPPQYPQQYATPAPQVAYAGFWLRVVAAIIDGLILTIPTGVLFLLLFASALPELMRNQGDPTVLIFTFLPRFLLLGLIYIIGAWLYWAKLESSSWQATLGKKALGLYVTDLQGRPVNFAKASARYWAGRGLSIVPYLGGLYFLIDCICAGVTERKQAIHDMIAGCFVLRKA
ncbi:MAG TPA: RDD family protein [Candidatus Acidoferrum sp.]|nr:RDD family protein [Candidatus Acidoferrum sp.]